MSAKDENLSEWFKVSAFSPPSVEELNTLIPSCEILEFIDRGGMGAVYKARQKNLDRTVAIKVLPPAHQDRRGFADRFRREIKTLAKLNHPHIVAIYESGEAEGGLLYYVMEHVDGTTLLQRMDHGRMGPRQKLNAVIEICEALQYAHEKGVIHRDIKPSNILIDSTDCVKIADFGLAKMLATDAEDALLTASGDAVGTPEYVAPEVLNGDHPVDHRADIYSLGVMLYFMLTGHTPKGVWEPPSACGADKRLDDVVNRALQRDPGQRFQSALDLTGVLDEVLRQETNHIHSPPRPPHSRAAGPDEPTRHFAHEQVTTGRWKNLLPITGGLAVIAAAAFYLMRPPATDVRNPPANTPRGDITSAKAYDSRKFARWIFDHGGFLNATWSTRQKKETTSDYDVRDIAAVPDTDDFVIWRVNFVENPTFDDSDLDDLVGWCQRAGTVTNVGLQGTAITPAGLAVLPKMADTLVSLDIERTGALSEESVRHITGCVRLDYLRVTLRYRVDQPPGTVPDDELVERVKAGLPDLKVHMIPPGS